MPRRLSFRGRGCLQMPVTFPGRMSVPSDTSNFPPSGNVDDRRQPGPIQKIKDAANDAYMVTRHMLGHQPGARPRYRPWTSRIPMIVSARSRTSAIASTSSASARPRCRTLKAAREEHEAATDAWFEKQAAFHAENEKWMAESETVPGKSEDGQGPANKARHASAPARRHLGSMPRYDRRPGCIQGLQQSKS